ncbi:helix-turn-helix domain-containing protein [Paenibacillus shenyangensis]|uniref:helix-turn-helix domain-containing protein n=1 Tax=Paenibacillus sp. A9 TaxID=1284352 RepID=UPI0009D9AAE7
MVGIGRESATKSLEEFQQDGIIQIQRRMIAILDFKNLYSLAGEAATGDRQWH